MSRHSTLRLVAMGIAIALSATALVPANAVVPDSPSAINTDQAGVALHGYDPVAYFTAGRPTLGKARFTAKHEGVTYRFASAANLKRFKANPDAHTPQFGGFCAMGVALDKKLDGDPKVWKIVDGKLYVNVNKDVQTAWLRDVPGNLVTAGAKWQEIKDKTPASLG
jgi:YHS domain-containing protein